MKQTTTMKVRAEDIDGYLEFAPEDVICIVENDEFSLDAYRCAVRISTLSTDGYYDYKVTRKTAERISRKTGQPVVPLSALPDLLKGYAA